MSEALSFQDIIVRLLGYWKEQGCLIQQPYNIQVGAGTMNPATVLRVLGPEPWNVVYVEPSIRPDDGRFGDNPNRMQMHHQLQVILKPDPGNPQELYLASLEALGIHARAHDIRFVEDNWESPALGAWGLGWEVWLDGQEITQFTYFQQAGGQILDPVAVEITYGLDRIALALQGLESVWQMHYGAGIAYGDLLLASEIEHCKYYFEVADVEALKVVYDTYEREAQRCLDARLAVPAHDYNLKCSHLFNVLDTRGAIGVTERASYFRRMRNLARDVSALYVEQRKEQNYPLLKQAPRTAQPVTPEPEAPVALGESAAPFVLEIGSEELPAADLTAALQQLQTALPGWLEELRLEYEGVEVHGTPRRLVIFIASLAARQPDRRTVITGPPAERAFDAEGRPTAAAQGFARGRGVDVADLHVVEEKGRHFVAATIHEVGRSSIDVLAEALPKWLAAISFGRSMRWNQSNIAYSRPLRWLLALHGPGVVPIRYADVVSGRTSRGLRPYGSPPLVIDEAAHYGRTLRDNRILMDVEERQDMITAATTALAQEHGGVCRHDPALLEEVANLVECPTALCGRFDERFLRLPAEVLVAVMKHHQRYFPVYSPEGALLPYFLTVRNGDEQHRDTVIAGNEQVLRARFADAEFFYHADTQLSLNDFLPRLATLTFQTELGSMLDKGKRLEQLTPRVAQLLNLPEEDVLHARRAAALAKADLATHMVVEMTSLQGIMGGHYARLSGESEAVAIAIAEQYQPVSNSRLGLALALADRCDSLLGLFAAGLAPRGSNDPFALRRAALGVIENLIVNRLSCDVRQIFAEAVPLLPIPCPEATREAVLQFLLGRLEGVLRERGYPATAIKAVLAAQGHNPFLASEAVAALSKAMLVEDWLPTLEAYARCVRITRALEGTLTLRPEAFELAAEQSLYAAYEAARASLDGSVPTLIEALRALVPAITQFFIDVLVMDEDMARRQNRLGLLQHIARLPAGIADLSHLEGF